MNRIDLPQKVLWVKCSYCPATITYQLPHIGDFANEQDVDKFCGRLFHHYTFDHEGIKPEVIEKGLKAFKERTLNQGVNNKPLIIYGENRSE